MSVTPEVIDPSASSALSRAFAYDAFFVHAATDKQFVEGYLLPKLGLAPNRVLLPNSLELGRFVVSELERGVQSSRATIVVLSPAYIVDHWAEFGEQIAAYASIARDAHGQLLPLLLRDCTLPPHIRALVALDFRDTARHAWEHQVGRLRAYLGSVVPPEPEVHCPYPGMRPFTEAESKEFFGRDREIERLVRCLRRGSRELYLIGASGCGKSSMIAAGLVPRLTSGVKGLPRFVARTVRPADQPMERLADALGADGADPAEAVQALLAQNATAGALLLVVDQLEELFAVTREDQRSRFAAAVRTLRADPRCVLVLVTRADFYRTLLASPLWLERSKGASRIEVMALRGNELRAAIEKPARNVGVYFQPDLVSRLLNDVAREPLAIPYLQETLLQLWERRRARLLTLTDYEDLGDGVQTGFGYIVKEHAEDVLGGLSEEHKRVALGILLRLVNFGEGRADTRRQQPRDNLRADEAAGDFNGVLECLIENRLVVAIGGIETDNVRIDLAHELLIHTWPTFEAWTRERRAAELQRRALKAAAVASRVPQATGNPARPASPCVNRARNLRKRWLGFLGNWLLPLPRRALLRVGVIGAAAMSCIVLGLHMIPSAAHIPESRPESIVSAPAPSNPSPPRSQPPDAPSEPAAKRAEPTPWHFPGAPYVCGKWRNDLVFWHVDKSEFVSTVSDCTSQDACTSPGEVQNREEHHRKDRGRAGELGIEVFRCAGPLRGGVRLLLGA